MGLLSSFIGSAATAGGEIMQRQREADVELASRKSMADYSNELELKRQEVIRQAQEEMAIRQEGRNDTRTIATETRTRENLLNEEKRKNSPEYLAQQEATAGIVAKGQQKIRGSLVAGDAEIAAAAHTAGAPTRKAAQEEKMSFALDEYRQKTSAELQADIARLNDPKYLAGKSKEAAAGRDPNSAAAAGVQLKIAQLALAEKQAEAKIPPAVRLALEPYKKEMDLVGKAIAEAQGTNMFDAASQNGKDLLARHSAAAKAYSDKLTPFLPEGLKTPEKAEPSSRSLPTPTPQALDFLKKNPGTRAQFEQMYGTVPATDAPKKDSGGVPDRPVKATPPSMEDSQAQFRRRNAELKAGNEKFASDPRVPQLRAKYEDAMRRGKAVEANNYLAQVNEIKKSHGL